MITRRAFLRATTTGLAGAAMAPRLWAAGPARSKILVSSCHANLVKAEKAGLDGIEIVVYGVVENHKIADPEVRARLKVQMKEAGLKVSSLAMFMLNATPLATDERGPAWLEQCIGAAGDLGAHTIPIPFFGKGELKDKNGVKKADVDAVVERLKAAAPKAKEAGVFLGIENTLSAEQNLEILKRIGHDSVRICYNCFNLTGEGYDVPAEIRLLKDRISMFHFKNGPDYLEGGKMKWEPIAAAMKEIRYEGWITLEAACPSKNRVDDERKNADYIRKLFA